MITLNENNIIRFSSSRSTCRTNLSYMIIFLFCFHDCVFPGHFVSGLLLGNLPTPSVVIDLQALRKNLESTNSKVPDNMNHVALSLSTETASGLTLFPVNEDSDMVNYDAPEIIIEKKNSDQRNIKPSDVWGYAHGEIIRAKEDAVEFRDNFDKFLGEVNIPRNMVGPLGARPCLGLNNHHVGS